MFRGLLSLDSSLFAFKVMNPIPPPWLVPTMFMCLPVEKDDQRKFHMDFHELTDKATSCCTNDAICIRVGS